MEGQLKLKQAKVLCIGAGGLGSPVALYLAAAGSALWVLSISILLILTNLQRQILHWHRRCRAQETGFRGRNHRGINPNVDVRKFETRLTSAQRARDHSRLRHRRRWHRQFPYPLPGQRRLRAHWQAQCLRLDLPLRRAGQCLRDQRWPVLSLPVSRTAAAGPGALVRRGRSAGSSARPGRRHPGDRDHQADPGRGRTADRAPVAGRCAGHALPRTQAAQESRLPGLRRLIPP